MERLLRKLLCVIGERSEGKHEETEYYWLKGEKDREKSSFGPARLVAVMHDFIPCLRLKT